MYIHIYKLLSLQSMYALYVWHVVDSATLAEMTLSWTRIMKSQLMAWLYLSDASLW